MVEKDIQMKHYNEETEQFENLNPLTTDENVMSKKHMISIADLLRFVPVGKDALETLGSVYIPNDHNLFGKTPEGDYYNLITPQDNGILDIGDMKVPVMWLQTKGYHSLRAPLSPSYQKVDELGNPIGAGRTIKHQENSSGHLVVFSVGEHVLETGIYSELHTLTNVNGQFPPDSYSNFYYKIPRAGIYHFNPIIKLLNAPQSDGYLRFGIRFIRNGQTTVSDMDDVYYNPSGYGTPFISSSFQYRFSKDDLVQVVVRPLKEQLTIGAGTKLYMYQLGDTIQE